MMVPKDKKKIVKELRTPLKGADSVGLFAATDEDREGRCIIWHLLQLLVAEGSRQADGPSIEINPRKPELARPLGTRPANSTMELVMPRRPGGSGSAGGLHPPPLAPRKKVAWGLSAGRCNRWRWGCWCSVSQAGGPSAAAATGNLKAQLAKGKGRLKPS